MTVNSLASSLRIEESPKIHSGSHSTHGKVYLLGGKSFELKMELPPLFGMFSRRFLLSFQNTDWATISAAKGVEVVER